jgi:hypothetical protein
MGASHYEPNNVYTPDIGIVDGPLEYLTVGEIRLPLPFTTRMTVVRLSNGDLFLHSLIRFNERLARELRGVSGFAASCLPTSSTMRTSGNGRGRFLKQSPGRHPVCADGREHGTWKSTSRETSTSLRPKNGVGRSTNCFFPAAISRSSFSSIGLQGR